MWKSGKNSGPLARIPLPAPITREKWGAREECADSCIEQDFLPGVLISGRGSAMLRYVLSKSLETMEEIMEWTAPAFEEVCLNCEINSYASAKL